MYLYDLHKILKIKTGAEDVPVFCVHWRLKTMEDCKYLHQPLYLYLDVFVFVRVLCAYADWRCYRIAYCLHQSLSTRHQSYPNLLPCTLRFKYKTTQIEKAATAQINLWKCKLVRKFEKLAPSSQSGESFLATSTYWADFHLYLSGHPLNPCSAALSKLLPKTCQFCSWTLL